jgi:hypothetical protein
VAEAVSDVTVTGACCYKPTIIIIIIIIIIMLPIKP